MVQIDFKSNKVTLNISDIHPSQDYLLRKVIKNSGFRSNSGTIECVKPLIQNLTTYNFKYCLSPTFVKHCTEVITECKEKEKITLEKIECLERDHSFRLYPFQVSNVLRMCQARSILNCGEPGTGKQHPVYTKICTPNGYVPIGSLRLGDYITSSTGSTTRITGIFPQGIQPVYKITFSDNSNVEAGPEHLWTILYTTSKGVHKKKTITTDKLMSYVNNKRIHGVRIPTISSPIKYNSNNVLPIDPYVLGLLIADGTLGGSTPVFTTHVKDWEYFHSRIKNSVTIGMIQTINNCVRVSFLDMMHKIKYLNLNCNSLYKKIPDMYLHASVSDRIKLLNGLMDGDGHISKTNNRISYYTSSYKLAKDVKSLIQHLGGTAKLHLNTRKDKKNNPNVEYKLAIKLPKSIKSVSLPRKLNRFSYTKKCEPRRYIRKVEYIHEYESVCIAVDARNHLYVTEEAIVTHNTIQALMTLPGGVDNSPTPGCLVLGPRASLNAWRKEISSRRPDLTLTSQKGSQSFRWPVQNEVIFLTYDSLLPLKSEAVKDSLDLDSFYSKLKEPIYLIADEVHFCKSFKTSRTKRFRSLTTAVLRKGGNVIGLTGTPLVNKPIEFWCILQNLGLAKETFGDWDSFAECMGGSKNRYGGWQWNSDLQSPSIHDILSRCVIRNKLEDVFPEMPSVVKDNFYVDLEDTLLQHNLDELWKDLSHLSNDEILDMISNPTFETFSKTRSKLSDLKIQSTIDLISEYEEYGEPIIVVSSYKKPVQTIGKRKGWKCITGSVSHEERLAIEQEFQDGKLKGLAMTIRSSGVSLNLQNSSRMIFIDRDYTVANNRQAEGRIYRIGQTKPCYYHYVLLNHPMEYRINEILEEKQAMVDTILEPIKNAPESSRNSKGQLLEEVILAHRI